MSTAIMLCAMTSHLFLNCLYALVTIFQPFVSLPVSKTFILLSCREAEDLDAVQISSSLAAEGFLPVFNSSLKVWFRKLRGCYWQNFDQNIASGIS